MADMVRRPNMSNIKIFLQCLGSKRFSTLLPLERNLTHTKYLKGARTAERSIRVMSKEGARMPSDVGLLDSRS